jgi:hypothetical protein
LLGRGRVCAAEGRCQLDVSVTCRRRCGQQTAAPPSWTALQTQLSTTDTTPAAAAGVMGMPASGSTQQPTALLCGVCKLLRAVAWCISFVPWAFGWLLMSGCYLLCCFAGAVFGTLRYVYKQAAERSVHYLAWVLCYWSLGVATAVVIRSNSQCMHSRLPQSSNLH